MKVITKRPNGTRRVFTRNTEPSKTKQDMKKDCDVNFIVQKFMKTGQMSQLNQNQGSYADVTGIKDLLDS
ncbi:MAG: hypothetical protein QW786_03165, partial [Candidatus Hadarchaeum sp.]